MRAQPHPLLRYHRRDPVDPAADRSASRAGGCRRYSHRARLRLRFDPVRFRRLADRAVRARHAARASLEHIRIFSRRRRHQWRNGGVVVPYAGHQPTRCFQRSLSVGSGSSRAYGGGTRPQRRPGRHSLRRTPREMAGSVSHGIDQYAHRTPHSSAARYPFRLSGIFQVRELPSSAQRGDWRQGVRIDYGDAIRTPDSPAVAAKTQRGAVREGHERRLFRMRVHRHRQERRPRARGAKRTRRCGQPHHGQVPVRIRIRAGEP